MPSPSILPMPGMPQWLAGLLQAGGVATVVIDVRSRFQIGAGTSAAAVIVVAPQMESEKRSTPVGLLVDKVLDTALIRPSEVLPIRESTTLPFRDFVAGVWRGRSRACYLLNIGKVTPEDFEIHLQTIFSSFR